MPEVSIRNKLAGLGLNAELIDSFPDMAPDVTGVLLYGSQARGDSVPGSDVDILALANSDRPSIHVGDINISFYTIEQLTTGIGTLFGAHLRRDGKIVKDDDGRLREALDQMGSVDVPRLLCRARAMSTLFSCPAHDLPEYLPGLYRQARYLLRSCLYGRAIEQGNPCFSVRELAVRHGDQRLVHLLSSRFAKDPTETEYTECLDRLERILGNFPVNSHGSLEATVVNEWGTQSDVLSMAFMVLGGSGSSSDYAEVEKILL